MYLLLIITENHNKNKNSIQDHLKNDSLLRRILNVSEH